MIESADDATEQDGILVHVGDCDQQWGSAYDEAEADEEGSTRQRDQHRPPYLLDTTPDQ